MNKQMPEEWQQKYQEQRAATLEEMNTLLVKEYLDDDGYPTDTVLRLIEIWWWEDPRAWFKFINQIWTHRSWGWHEELADHEHRKDTKVIRYNISTGGWSGNESIIRAMEKNCMMWSLHWVQSRRGGHYIFEVPEDTEDEE